ncbi:MAG: hypothetical protein QM784_20900 [Polyangiaceae bacterium]
MLRIAVVFTIDPGERLRNGAILSTLTWVLRARRGAHASVAESTVGSVQLVHRTSKQEKS